MINRNPNGKNGRNYTLDHIIKSKEVLWSGGIFFMLQKIEVTINKILCLKRNDMERKHFIKINTIRAYQTHWNTLDMVWKWKIAAYTNYACNVYAVIGKFRKTYQHDKFINFFSQTYYQTHPPQISKYRTNIIWKI